MTVTNRQNRRFWNLLNTPSDVDALTAQKDVIQWLLYQKKLLVTFFRCALISNAGLVKGSADMVDCRHIIRRDNTENVVSADALATGKVVEISHKNLTFGYDACRTTFKCVKRIVCRSYAIGYNSNSISTSDHLPSNTQLKIHVDNRSNVIKDSIIATVCRGRRVSDLWHRNQCDRSDNK